MVQQWKQWCRLCSSEDDTDNHINIFEKDEEASQFRDIVSKCFAIDISSDDRLPQTVCQRCHEFINSIQSFNQKATKVQAMYAEFLNSLDDIDHDQMKVQFEIHELDDDEIELKILSNTPVAQLYDSKPDMSAGLPEQMIDLEELDYIDDEMYNGTNIKKENSEEDTLVMKDDEEWKREEHLSTTDEDSNESLSHKPKLESDDSEDLPKKRTRGRPVKCRLLPSKPRIDEKFTCAECGKPFQRYPNFRHHMQMEHDISLEPQQFPCTKCDKVFSTRGRLQDHGNSHVPLEQKRTIPCPYCDKKFTKSGVVQAHVSSVHMGEKPFICEECGKTYKTFGALKEHKLTHTDERLFKCTWCEKRFKSKARLKTHEDTHNETNYVCTTCGLQLNTRRTLRMHMVVHSDQKRHKCDFCGNEYKRAKALKSHLILHTGLKPYTCNFCDKTFANGSNCRSHKKKAHPTELAALEAAGTKCASATNIPKLEQLRAVTSNKAAILQSISSEPDFSESVSVVSLPDDAELDSSPDDSNDPHQIGLVHAVFGSINGS